MNPSLAKYALYAIIAGLTISLLGEWTRFSASFDTAREAEQRKMQQSPLGASLPAIPGDTPDTSRDPLALANEQLDQAVTEAGATDAVAEVDDSPTAAQNAAGRTITVHTDTLRVVIDRLGGDIVEVALLKHLTTLEKDAEPLRLLEKNRLRIYTAQSGLIARHNGSDSQRPLFESDQTTYQMDGETLEVVLRHTTQGGISYKKIYRFETGEHTIDVRYQVENRSSESWKGTFYAQISRDNSEDPGTENAAFGMQSYLGAATTTEESPYQKVPFKDIEKKDFRYTHTDGWIAMIQHYFVSAWVPPRGEKHTYFTKRGNNNLNIIGLFGQPFAVEPGESASTGALFYAGPKNQYRLAEIAEHLDLTIDYGWLWMLAQPLYALLHLFATGELHAFGKVFDVFGGFNNWGVAIIMLTIVVKLVFFRLSASSYRSMANMRRVQPKLLAIRDRYKSDKQAQSKAMMELYQKEKINPLGGCLPILIQMPVFIALYWALMESVELRHAPFALWIKDLSVMDPYFILPLLMGATMWFQQRMNPAPPDPMQAKVMAWMPVIFTFFFLWFPAGLVIYWVSNNILSIAQQWVITRQIEKAAEKPA